MNPIADINVMGKLTRVAASRLHQGMKTGDSYDLQMETNTLATCQGQVSFPEDIFSREISLFTINDQCCTNCRDSQHYIMSTEGKKDNPTDTDTRTNLNFGAIYSSS